MDNFTGILKADKPTLVYTNGGSAGHLDPNTFDNLYPALIQCFLVIFLGYGAGRLGFISPTSSKGIGVFISHASLPALLLKSMIELNLSMVNWKFMASILIAKGTVFITVLIFSLLLLKPLNYGRAGIFAIFATQSNDFALGYPVLKAIYADSHPEYLKYIYLVAPISLVCLNPIGFLMMEYQRQKSAEDQTIHKLRLISRTFKGVITDPVVFMTFIGIIWNFISDHEMPSLLHKILDNLGSAFFATSLFYLGIKMVGNMKKQLGLALFVPFLLIFAKTLFLPLIAREIIVDLNVGLEKNDTVSWSMLGFLYGTFPTAPTVVIFAVRYGFEADTMASGMVMCTFLAAPIMFTSAQMSQFNNKGHNNFKLVQESLFDTSCVAIPCAILVFVVFLLGRRYKEKPHNFTLCLLLCQFILALSGVLSTISSTSMPWRIVMFVIFMGSCFGSRCWTSLVALGLLLIRCNGSSGFNRWNIFIHIVGWGVPILCCGVLLCFVDLSLPSTSYKPSFISYVINQTPVIAVSIVVLVGTVVTTVVCLVRLQRCDRYCKCPERLQTSRRSLGGGSFFGNECNKDRCGRCQEISKEIAEEQSQSNCNVSNGEVDSCCAAVSPGENSVLNIENLDETTCLLQKSSSSLHRRYSQDSFTVLASVETELNGEYFYGEKHQVGRHVTLLLLLSISTCLGIFLCVWRLLGEPKESGIYVALEVLDVVLLFGQSFMVFACFGFEKQLVIIPFMKKLRRLFYGVEELCLPRPEVLDPEVVHQCDQFKRYHKQRCQRALACEKRYHFRTYKNVFRGDELVDWILEVGLAADRQAAVHYGKSLILGRIIEHVVKEHHFHDLPYFYKFCS